MIPSMQADDEKPARTTWITPFHDLWVANVGDVAPARMAKALQPLMAKEDKDLLLQSMQGYIADNTRNVKRVEFWAAEWRRWLPRQKAALVDHYGGLTPEGLRTYQEGR